MNSENKYRHKLIVRSSKIEESRLIRGIYSPTLNDWCEVLQDYIHISRTRRLNKLAMLKLQVAILGDIIIATDLISKYCKLLNDPNEPRRHIPEPEPIDKLHFETWERELYANKILLSALKDIGDGIAWRLLRYNRPLLYILSLNESPGSLKLDQGLMSEISALQDITTDEEISEFVIHAITNTARLADITTVTNTGEVEFVEVKSKDSRRGIEWKERVNRQIRRSDNLIKIANEGSGLADNQGIVVRTTKAKPVLPLKELRSTLVGARVVGTASRVLRNYQAIIGIDWRVLKEKSNDTFNTALKSVETTTLSSIRNEGDKFLMIDSLNLFEFSPHRAPLSIFPFEEGDIADLLVGRKTILYAFNITRFLDEFKSAGWMVVKSLADDPKNYNANTDPFCVLRKGRLTIEIPPSLFARAIFEGLAVRSILQICEEIVKEGPNNPHRSMIFGFSGEEYLWN